MRDYMDRRVPTQRAKKVVSDSPGLVDFAIGLVNSVFNLPDGQVIFFEEFEKQKNCEINSAVQKAFGLVEMTSGLVNGKAVKMIFFATCYLSGLLHLPGVPHLHVNRPLEYSRQRP